MKVGKYQIGRFHAIIRKEYADGSVDYWQGYKTLLNLSLIHISEPTRH